MRPETAAISPATLALLTLDHRSHEPLQDQLLAALRKLILERALLPGQRVPSSRALAQQLGVSRNTVLAAFDQLQSEGYFAGTRGSGTYVAPTLPEQFLKVSANSPRSGAASAIATSASRTVAKPGAQHEVSPAASAATGGAHFTWPARPFRPCVPSVAEFPIDVWESLRRRVLRRRGTRLLEYSVAHGDPALREQIAIYLRDYRGVRCEAEQIIVTAGAQQAFGLIARVMGGPGGGVWMEDPGYTDALSAFEAAGLTVHSLAIDPEGMVLPRTAKRGVSLAYMTPSRQFPLGVTMSLTRRMAWLNYAQQHGVWLIEDDYDSEYRYVGRPLPSLQGLAPETRVIYVR
jgi:GntR family transcriptional regulator/MocR family aminotransferase